MMNLAEGQGSRKAEKAASWPELDHIHYALPRLIA